MSKEAFRLIKKKIGMIVASSLVAGLVACNNNEAIENLDDNRFGTVDVSDNVNYNGRNYGPLSRNMNTKYRDEGNDLRTSYRNGENNYDFDFVPDRFFNDEDVNQLTISSSKTDMSSRDYPHTRAIAVQEAKFKTIRADSVEEAKQQANKYIQQQMGQAQQRIQQETQQRTTQGNQEQAQAPEPEQKQEQAQAPEPEQKQEQAPKQVPEQQQQAQQQAPSQQEQAPAENKQETEESTQGLSEAVQQVIELTNRERRNNGLPDLKADTQLSGVAQKKSEDMRQNNYFSHTSPTYGSPFDMMRDFGVTYKTAGENIAQGQQTPEQVVQAWMNSEGHRKNILSKDFTHIGVGYDENGHHWTQMFIGK